MSAAREAFERLRPVKDSGEFAAWDAWEAFEAGWGASSAPAREELFPGVLDALDNLVSVREGKKSE